jgi:hypothetical protein
LSHVWSGWRTALIIVKPETVVGWHRKGFRLFWTWKSRRRTGRPPVRKVASTCRQSSVRTSARAVTPLPLQHATPSRANGT